MKVFVSDLAAAMGMSEYDVQKAYQDMARFFFAPQGCKVELSSLPAEIQTAYHAAHTPVSAAGSDGTVDNSAIVPSEFCVSSNVPVAPTLDSDASAQAEIYAETPSYNRKGADKRTTILAECEGLCGAELDKFVEYWKTKHPGEKLSPKTIYRWRGKKAGGDPEKFLPQYGKRRGHTSVPDDLYSYFKKEYMTQGCGSVFGCWMATMGHAKKLGYDLNLVPKHGAFKYRLDREELKDAVYAARHGFAAANRKYGDFIIRNYNDVYSGYVWVSDHAQIDVAVRCKVDGTWKVMFPWVTVMRDFKSGYWVGWYIHADAPNSDHIFTAFHRAAIVWGIPGFLYLDNGKDYRCKDFAGGRITNIKANVDEVKTTSMCGQLGIKVIYANPYNAQAKPVERDFLNNKIWFSKHNPGYRGGNVVERPEDLNKKIKNGAIHTLKEVEALFDKHIKEVAMMLPVMSKRSFRYGKGPIDIWNAERPEAIKLGLVRSVSDRALAMFCCRTSGVKTIGKNGVLDGELGKYAYYYGEWMSGQKGRKVYLRRDPKMFSVAWVFDAETDVLIDFATLDEGAAALAQTPEQRKKLEKAIARKQTNLNILKAYADPGGEVTHEEHVENLAIYAKHVREETGLSSNYPVVEPVALQVTHMDIELAQYKKRKENEVVDLDDLDAINSVAPESQPPKKKILDWFDDDPDEAEGGDMRLQAVG